MRLDPAWDWLIFESRTLRPTMGKVGPINISPGGYTFPRSVLEWTVTTGCPKANRPFRRACLPLTLAPIGTGSTDQPPSLRSEAVELTEKNKRFFQVTPPRDPSDRYTLAIVVRHSRSPRGRCAHFFERKRGRAHPAEVNAEAVMLYERVLSTLSDTTQLCSVNTFSPTSLLSPPIDKQQHAL